MGKTKKNSQHSKNVTKKYKPTTQMLSKYCKITENNAFEEEYEKKFTDNLVKTNKDIEKKLIELFNVPYVDSKINAKNDYYSFINHRWEARKTVELNKDPKYFVQFDSFRVVQDQVYHELIDIVKEYVKTNDTRESRALGNLYESLLRLDDDAAELFTTEVVETIDNLIESNNIYSLIGRINHNEIISWGSPLVWSVLKDEKEPTIYRSYITPPQLTIYDYTIYIEDVKEDQNNKKYKRLFKEKYFQFINDMFDACLGKGHGLKAQDVWDCEYDMLVAMGCDSIKTDDESGYNLVNNNESIKKCGLDWDALATKIGYKDVPNKYICTSLNYVKCILETLTTDDAWKSTKWKTYYFYLSFRQVIRFHSKWRMIHYEFFEKFIKGIPTPMPRDIYPIGALSMCFDNLLSKEYIKRNKKQDHIDYIHNMYVDLLTVYKRIIKRNTWLSPSTKKYALKKLQYIKIILGYPDKIRDDVIYDYSNKGAYQNLMKMVHNRYKKLIKLDGKSSNASFPIIDWSQFKLVGKQPYIVNAFYTPTENSIYIPLAYMQKPFIDLEQRGIEYNLVHIGNTLAHEMSHCLDDMGSKYDHEGFLKNWWTEHDRRVFNAKIHNVIKQYEQFAMYDGIKMDASLSTGENLADISGLAICVEYLRDFQDKNEEPISIRDLSFRTFFVYFAMQARQKIYDGAIKAQLKTNPHPMDKYRTNCPLARLELFKSIYNIKKGDKMYWENNDTIW